MTCAQARGLWRQPALRSLVRSDLLVARRAKVDEALGKASPAVDLGEQFGNPKTRQQEVVEGPEGPTALDRNISGTKPIPKRHHLTSVGGSNRVARA